MNKNPQKDDMEEFRALGEHYKVLVEETSRSAALLHEAEQKRKAAQDVSGLRVAPHSEHVVEPGFSGNPLGRIARAVRAALAGSSATPPNPKHVGN